MGGKTKYILNGHNAQQQTVQNLFQSVQLNINNPHFLIMQGRITKVLNMKPTEILSMVEEAAGTKMFEDRKNKAFATMAKKDRKMDEINSVCIKRKKKDGWWMIEKKHVALFCLLFFCFFIKINRFLKKKSLLD